MTSDEQAAILRPVQRQLDAYNARDIDGFMACWADDCRYFGFPGQLLATGQAAVRARHEARFQEPNLHGALVSRSSVGNLVVDHETVTRTFPDGPGEVEVIALYEVEHGRIAQAWFKMGTARLHPPGAVSIRPAAARDAEAIRSLTREAYAKWVPVLGREPKPMTADYEQVVRQHRIDLLYRDGALAALIEMVPEPGCLLIKNLAVRPGQQGRGLGRHLLARAETLAATLGLAGLRLYANRLFAVNIRLYQSLGYVIDREEAFMGGMTVHLSKRL